MSRHYGQGPNLIAAGAFLGMLIIFVMLAVVRVYS